MRKTWFPGAVVLLGLAACSSESLKEFTPSDSDKTSAVSVVSDTQSLQELKTDASSDNALGKFSTIQSNATSLAASASGKALSLAVPLSVDDSCVTESGGTITYNNCSGGGETIDGTISVNGDTLAIDLDITFSSSGYDGALSYRGSVTVTDLLVSGSLSFEYTYSSVKYVVDVDYDNLVLDAACAQGPVGGSLSVDVSTKISGLGSLPGGSGSQSVRVDFGPACGDMKFFGK